MSDYPNPGAHTPLRPAVPEQPPAAQGEAQVPFGWAVLDKKGCTERVISRVHYEFAHIEPVIRSEPDPKELLAYLDREYKGAAPHRIVTLYTAPPADAPTFPAGLHPRTADLVHRFSAAMAEKLYAAQEKYGYSDGWANDDWLDECRTHLLQHVAKGDPRDVANYAAFLWHHGASTAGAPADARDAELRDFIATRLTGAEIDCDDEDGDSYEVHFRLPDNHWSGFANAWVSSSKGFVDAIRLALEDRMGEDGETAKPGAIDSAMGATGGEA